MCSSQNPIFIQDNSSTKMKPTYRYVIQQGMKYVHILKMENILPILELQITFTCILSDLVPQKLIPLAFHANVFVESKLDVFFTFKEITDFSLPRSFLKPTFQFPIFSSYQIVKTPFSDRYVSLWLTMFDEMKYRPKMFSCKSLDFLSMGMISISLQSQSSFMFLVQSSEIILKLTFHFEK